MSAMHGRRSRIWTLFTPLNKAEAICSACNKKISFRTSTSNLRRHFELKHPTLFNFGPRQFRRKYPNSTKMHANNSIRSEEIESSDQEAAEINDEEPSLLNAAETEKESMPPQAYAAENANNTTLEISSEEPSLQITQMDYMNNQQQRADDTANIVPSAYMEQNMNNPTYDNSNMYNGATAQRDQYSLFGEQIGIQIRQLPSQNARNIVQHIINTAIFEAQMGKFNNVTGLAAQNVINATQNHCQHCRPAVGSARNRTEANCISTESQNSFGIKQEPFITSNFT